MNPFSTNPVNFFGNKVESKIILDENGNELKLIPPKTKKYLNMFLVMTTLFLVATHSFAGESRPRLAGGNGGATGRPN